MRVSGNLEMVNVLTVWTVNSGVSVKTLDGKNASRYSSTLQLQTWCASKLASPQNGSSHEAPSENYIMCAKSDGLISVIADEQRNGCRGSDCAWARAREDDKPHFPEHGKGVERLPPMSLVQLANGPTEVR